MAEPQSKRRKVAGSGEGKAITDPRFANIQSDPRYRLPSKKHKVKLDKRFSRALKDDDFSRRAKVDRYGRTLENDSERKRLKRKYEFEEEEDSSENDEADDDDEVQNELARVTSKPRDILREGRDSESSSEPSSSSEDDLSDASDIEDAELAPQTKLDVPTGEISSRLAVVNLDWDNIRAQDLMAVFSSSGFLPSNGRLLKASIYPSEFGKERMAREEMEGPPPEIFARSDSNARHEDSDSASEASDDEEAIKQDILAPDSNEVDFDSTALRNYQLSRLRYYYAILSFSSPSAAKAIYDAVDGTEYLSTANFFDLRFVPSDTDFSSDTPREECTSIPPDYKPNDFVTDALQHSKVKLTWDAEDGSRKEAQARAFRGDRKAIDENDLKAYLGTDSSSASEAEEETSTSRKEEERQRMRSLLGLSSEPAKSKKSKEEKPVGGVHVTFSAGLSSTSNGGKKRSVFENSPEPDETTTERYIRKEHERKQKRKEKAKVNRDGINAAADGVPAADKEEDLGFEDPFFAEPHLDKAASKKAQKEERLKKKKAREEKEQRELKQRAELELLMADDASSESEAGGEGKKKRVRHFDMREIEKTEKAGRKADRRTEKKRKKAKDSGAISMEGEGEGVDRFKLDPADPRFASLYENHEYAIDPTNPRYKGTKGMQELLEEGRRRKGRKEKKTASAVHSGGANDEVKSLVEKIKKRKA